MILSTGKSKIETQIWRHQCNIKKVNVIYQIINLAWFDLFSFLGPIGTQINQTSFDFVTLLLSSYELKHIHFQTRAVFILRAQVFLNLHPSTSKLMLYQVTYFEAHPINGFSQRSIVSNSICQFFVLNEPDCVAVRAGTKILAFLSLTSQSGTPVVVSITS